MKGLQLISALAGGSALATLVVEIGLGDDVNNIPGLSREKRRLFDFLIDS